VHVALKLIEAVYWIGLVFVALLGIYAVYLGFKVGGDDDQATEGHSTDSETSDRD
jgi:hypothetical protein